MALSNRITGVQCDLPRRHSRYRAVGLDHVSDSYTNFHFTMAGLGERDVLASVIAVFLIGLSIQYAVLAPYSKIEESFNTQAIHDMLFVGNNVADYDNTAFPSVVPRTFIGSVAISALAQPFKYVLTPGTRQGWQLLTRIILAMVNLASIGAFSHTLSIKPRRWFLLFTLAQFHITFYVSRMLPNMFAFPLVMTAYTWFQTKQYFRGLVLLTVTGIVFRGELAALVAPLSLVLALNKVPLMKIINAGIVGVVIGSALTICVDSYFTGRLTFPEVEGFVFNVIEGKASDWGTEPWWTYAVRHLPNILGDPLIYPAAVIGLFTGTRQLRVLGWACVGFVAAYSLQPHKELRFIIYVVPIFTALASQAVSRLNLRRGVDFVLFWVLLASVFAALGVSVLKATVSSYNYPGGEALKLFHEIVPYDDAVNKTVHIDVLSFRTGHTRFGEEWRDEGVVYHRTEDENVSIESLWPTFDYLVGEINYNDLPVPEEWEQLATVNAYTSINPGALRETAGLLAQKPAAIRGFLTDASALKEVIDKLVVTSPSIHIYKRIS